MRSPVTVASGTVAVSNFPATQPVSGSVSVSSGSVAVTNLPATQTVSGTVAVSNFPATQPVTLSGTRRKFDWLRQRAGLLLSRDNLLCLLRAIGLRGLHARLIENRTAALEYIPPDLSHLELFRDANLQPMADAMRRHLDAAARCSSPPRAYPCPRQE